MNYLVTFEINYFAELCPTQVTVVGFLSCMNPLVTFEMTAFPELLPTQVTVDMFLHRYLCRKDIWDRG